MSNGSFESNPAGEIPWGWRFTTSHGAKVTMQTSAKYSVEGAQSLLINNLSSHHPNVFGSLVQQLKLKRGIRYSVWWKIFYRRERLATRGNRLERAGRIGLG